MLYDYNYMTFWMKQNYRDSKKKINKSVIRQEVRMGAGVDEQAEHRGFLG